MNSETLRDLWKKDIEWTLTDSSQNQDDKRTAKYNSDHILELLSKNIFNKTERDDFKALSVSLSDYLKMVNFSEEINQLQLIALSISFGYFYRKLEEKHIVKTEEKSNDKNSIQKDSQVPSI